MGIAVFLRDIGKGADSARGLTEQAAHDLMRDVLEGRATPAECGAFVMAMRMKGETLDEISGFLSAAQEQCATVHSTQPVVMIPSYNGARKLPNLTPLLALWLAREGVRVLMHGPMADATCVNSAEVLQDLGMTPALQPIDVARAWQRREPAYMPTRVLCPPLQSLLDLRRLLGLRGPGHTVAKMLNPVVGAPALRLINHNHPQYGVLLTEWVQRDGADALMLRGTEGEPVADLRRLPRMDTWLGGQWRADLSCPAQEGVVAELPLLPRENTAASTALYAQEVLSGMRPAPPPLLRQIALVRAAVAALRARPQVLERRA